MAIILCPECGGKVSDRSVACVHCGFPLNTDIYSDTANDTDALIHEINNILNYVEDDEQRIVREIDELKNNRNILRCPRCKSTAVTTGSRGYSIVWGFAGSDRTVNRCGKCGHTWRPRRP